MASEHRGLTCYRFDGPEEEDRRCSRDFGGGFGGTRRRSGEEKDLGWTGKVCRNVGNSFRELVEAAGGRSGSLVWRVEVTGMAAAE